MKLTPFGRTIRKYRIDHGLLLKNMADRLGVSSAYLSALEYGTKPVTKSFEDRLLRNFDFSGLEKEELLKAIDLSRTEVTFDVANKPLEQQIAGAFCRNFSSLDEKKKKKILELLRGN